MTDPNGWPDPARPGVPMNPEQSGWHWVQEGTWPLLAVRWFATDQAWEGRAIGHGVWHYLGHCPTPAEVAARVAEARREGLREAAAIVNKTTWRCPNAGCTSIAAAILARAEGKP